MKRSNGIELLILGLEKVWKIIYMRGSPEGEKMFDFKRRTIFCLRYQLSKHKMTINSKHLGGHGPSCPLVTPMGVLPRLRACLQSFFTGYHFL